MKVRHLLSLLPFLIFCSCNGEQNSVKSASQVNHVFDTTGLKNPNLHILDTTVVLSNADQSYVAEEPILENEAELLLYKYFKAKGIENRTSIDASSKNLTDETFVSFDTIYQIRTEKISGAVISYWLGPSDLNGHCFQPRKAVILNTHQGIVLTNENFIPINFSVDSTVGRTILGYDYDCGGLGIVRYLRISIE